MSGGVMTPEEMESDAKGCYLDWCRIMNARLRIVRALKWKSHGL